MNPKAFISYSWTDQAYKEYVRLLADQLLADGIDVILDVYELQEGDDKHAYMERMVTDDSVTHVLVFSDKAYSNKANQRKAGVGTESQIISKEVYDSVSQNKFIPIVLQFDDDGQPCLPTFLQSRIWIDFSSDQKVNENWERLIRIIYGKPEFIKPAIGSTPSYISSDTPVPAVGVSAKFNSLRQAIMQNKTGVGLYRQDFLDSCLGYADELRVRKDPNVESIGEKVLEDAHQLKVLRDPLVDWVLLEGEFTHEGAFSEIIIEFLEKLRELKSRPAELTSWRPSWFEAHTLFVYEVFLYFIAALLKTKSYGTLNQIYTTHYLLPGIERERDKHFEKFVSFWGYSTTLQSVLAPEGRNLLSPAAELLKRHADRHGFPFSEIMQAELLTLLMSLITPDIYFHWQPQSLHYSGHGDQYPFFVRAAQHQHFKKMAIITGIDNADELRSLVRDGHQNWGPSNLSYSPISGMHFTWSLMNADNWDTLR